MAKLSITEYATLSEDGASDIVPLAKEPATAEQEVEFTTATQSSAFNTKTNFVRIVADAECRVVFGEDPTAVATSQRIIADIPEWRAVVPGQKVSVYDGSS